MFFFFIGFLLGDIAVQMLTTLPNDTVVYKFLIIAVALYFLKKYKLSRIMIGYLLGFSYAVWFSSQILNWSLPVSIENKPVEIVGHVVTIPIKKSSSTIFQLSLDKMATYNLQYEPLIMVTWHLAPSHLQVGDSVQLLVRLKRPHGLSNPGLPNQETWLFQNKIRATATVISSKRNLITGHSNKHMMTQLRQSIYRKILINLPHTPSSHWLPALMVGVRGDIPQDDWEVLRKTGTNHLMAIAGLHIGIIAGLAHAVISWIWKRSFILMCLVPAQIVGSIFSLIVAVFYSALAGFSIPTQRAAIMLSIFITTTIFRQKFNPWYAYAFTIFIILIINPLDIISDSFWLSFTTIAIILYGMSNRSHPLGVWWKWFRVQWVIGLGLIPLSIFLFHEVSWVGFLANTITIPILSATILPACLLYLITQLFSESFSTIILNNVAYMLDGMWFILIKLSKLTFSTSSLYFDTNIHLLLAVVGVILLLIPAGMPGRWVAMFYFLPTLWTFAPPLEPGEYRLTLLDVGQGLSTVVQTRSHILIFDTGIKLSADYDMGKRVLIPYLSQLKANKIDELVLSHGDNDHVGGAEAIMDVYPVLSLHTSVPERIKHHARLCLSGIHWVWDGVSFEFLHPSQGYLNKGNDSSCVLRISNEKYSALLTGDIEKPGEIVLLSTATNLKSDILVAPHHGSKTSGLESFIHAVRPSYVLYATGYLNRYHFPHADVKQAYDRINAISLDTAKYGAIIFDIKNNTLPIKLTTSRDMVGHYWNTA